MTTYRLGTSSYTSTHTQSNNAYQTLCLIICSDSQRWAVVVLHSGVTQYQRADTINNFWIKYLFSHFALLLIKCYNSIQKSYIVPRVSETQMQLSCLRWQSEYDCWQLSKIKFLGLCWLQQKLVHKPLGKKTERIVKEDREEEWRAGYKGLGTFSIKILLCSICKSFSQWLEQWTESHVRRKI